MLHNQSSWLGGNKNQQEMVMSNTAFKEPANKAALMEQDGTGK